MEMNEGKHMEYVREYFKLNKNFPFLMLLVEEKQVFLHRHDYLEINYVLEGDGYYLIGNRRYPIKQGDIYIINNKEPHVAIWENSFKMLVIFFNQELVWEKQHGLDYLQAFFNRVDEFSNRIREFDQGYKELKELFFKIKEENEAKKPGHQLILRSILMLFLAYVNRFYQINQSLTEDVAHFRKSYEKLQPLLDKIHRDYPMQLTLEELAKVTNMNKAYMCSYFKDVMQITVFDYIEQVRIKQGCNLLKHTDKPVASIAEEIGFNSVSYFNRVFKNLVGMTPIQYRKAKKVVE